MTAVLFDFNGTMFFDEKFQEKSWRDFIENKIGRCVSKEEFQSYIHETCSKTSEAPPDLSFSRHSVLLQF